MYYLEEEKMIEIKTMTITKALITFCFDTFILSLICDTFLSPCDANLSKYVDIWKRKFVIAPNVFLEPISRFNAIQEP